MNARGRLGPWPPATSHRGMTLVEILVALLILSLGATSLIALFASASATHTRAVDRTRAALVAEEILSEVQARYTLDVEPRELIDGLEASLPERIDGYHWEVVLHRPGEGDIRRDAGDGDGEWTTEELVVHVVIRWSIAAGAREERYTTILLPKWGHSSF